MTQVQSFVLVFFFPVPMGSPTPDCPLSSEPMPIQAFCSFWEEETFGLPAWSGRRQWPLGRRSVLGSLPAYTQFIPASTCPCTGHPPGLPLPALPQPNPSWRPRSGCTPPVTPAPTSSPWPTCTRKALNFFGGGGNSLVAQWLRLCAPNAGGPGSIPGQGTRSHMHAATRSLHATTKEPASCN